MDRTGYEKLAGARRVVIIGLDGATLDVIRPLADQGRLPVFSRIMSEGAYGELASTIPPVTAQAWTSCVTGVNPGKHGIFNFVGPATGNHYFRPYLTSRVVGVPHLWTLLSRQRKRVAVVNVPMSYPAVPVEGYMVAELSGRTGREPQLSHPPELAALLLEELGEYSEEPDHAGYYFTDMKDGYIDQLMHTADFREELLGWMLDRGPFDFFMMVFVGTDRVQHFFWKYMDPTHPAYDPSTAARYGDVIPMFYQRMDSMLGRLIDRLPDGTVLMIVSDHGHGPLRKRVYINRLFLERGLLRTRPGLGVFTRYRYPPWYYTMVFRLGRRFGVPLLTRPVPTLRPGSSLRDADPRLLWNQRFTIDWSRTQVYCGDPSEQGIFINVKGRQPLGTVEPGRPYQKMRESLRDQLWKLRDPETGERVVDEIWTQEEVYRGPYVDRACDLYLRMRGHSYMLNPYLFSPELMGIEKWHSGTHRAQGIFFLWGPGARKGVEVHGARIIDVAPTALYLMGCPIPDHMDGCVVEESIDTETLAALPLIQGSAEKRVVGETVSEDSEADQERMLEMLRGLGYLG